MVYVMAHRGASSIAPENSFMAFEKAIEHHSDYIEIDVRICETGELIVMHDSKIDRTTTGKGSVSKLSLKEIKKHHIKRVKKGYNKSIPTLEETIKFTKGKCKLNIEIKSKNNNYEFADKILELIEKYNIKDEVVISSYRHKILAKIHELNPDIETAALFIEKKSPSLILRRMYYVNSYIKKAKKINASAINLPYQFITSKLMKKAVYNGLKVNAWTVNSTKAIEKMKMLGVDGIITNYPQKFHKMKVDVL